ncbi:hypothetical protein [Streptomyces sp. NPDC048057]|uniref:DUF7848 domain-containing protein n=1 Tax=Streptomyces sp. NPDC048057 TaxID=3155628 RepID=UPI0033DB239F
MARSTYRFREHALGPDTSPDAEPFLHAMECKECGSSSDTSEESGHGSVWAVAHLKAHPGHLTYRAYIMRPYRFEPGEWL